MGAAAGRAGPGRGREPLCARGESCAPASQPQLGEGSSSRSGPARLLHAAGQQSESPPPPPPPPARGRLATWNDCERSSTPAAAAASSCSPPVLGLSEPPAAAAAPPPAAKRFHPARREVPPSAVLLHFQVASPLLLLPKKEYGSKTGSRFEESGGAHPPSSGLVCQTEPWAGVGGERLRRRRRGLTSRGLFAGGQWHYLSPREGLPPPPPPPPSSLG